MPAATLRRIALGPVVSPEGVILTTGETARLVGVAPRTVAKWCDSKQLPSWRLPLSGDRRLFAADLFQFLASRGAHVPAELVDLVAKPEAVLFRCPPRIAQHLDLPNQMHAVESLWDLGSLLGRPHRAGVVVCGEASASSEVAEVFRRAPNAWVKIHAFGPDQSKAAGADHGFANHETPALVECIRANLTRGRMAG
jgi:alkylated DNA nucleotide flippase Atl1